ncbi:hypothetical protein [Rhizobium sp. AB2/73]|uniref:SPW repeat domain-containing protein n=2 Tax=Rhizobium/Agrobacterium group TaxID=227290 RepID=UPI00084C7FBC|nr:hypothetical protein [Rhizobium sp. AB2/73]OEC95209.1 hypothetical protein A9Z06_31905 [Rhizobium sp. YK2]QYA15307.1 hypothetical protein J5284_20055 [Rhizobium sp. AB2/73]
MEDFTMREPRWQNWFGLLLGTLIFLMPWFAPDLLPVATASTMVYATGTAIGLTIVNVSILGIFNPEAWIDWLKFWLGLALLAAPWFLGFSGLIFFTSSFVCAAMLLIIVSGLAFASRTPRIGRK